MPTSHPQQLKAAVEHPARTTKKRISDEEWMLHKDSIERLYLDEGRDVREVRDTMKRDFNFDAHEKAYKRKFEEWGLIKNIPKEEGLFMVKKRERRREEEGKETIFRRRRRPDGPLQLVLDEKVDRIADRYSHDLNSYPHNPASTPDNIQYDTPDGTPGDEAPRKIKSESVGASSGSEWAFGGVPEARLNEQYFAGTDGIPHAHAHSSPMPGLPAHMAAMTSMTTMGTVPSMSGISQINGNVPGQMSGGIPGQANGAWDPWNPSGYF